jgi:flagella basal body P-ring formation protein FlgA
MHTRLLLAITFSSVAFAACVPITGNRILGRDLALADPQFSALPSSLTLGYAPSPGMKQTYTAAELLRLAGANGIQLQHPVGICFELPMLQVREEDAVAAMRRSLPPEAELKILDRPAADVPAGQLEFPIEGLEPPNPSTPGRQLWRGYVKYAETRKLAYWAQVQVTVRYAVVVTNKDLASNIAINAASLGIETRTGPLSRERIASRIEDVSGRILKRPLKAGAPVPEALLTDLPAVRRGDPVKVDVESGPAHLEFDAVAENSANAGEMVELRNPSSGKTFRARLDAGSKAVVIISPGQKL